MLRLVCEPLHGGGAAVNEACQVVALTALANGSGLVVAVIA